MKAKGITRLALAGALMAVALTTRAGTLATESTDYSNSYTDPTLTVSSAGSNTVTGNIGPTPDDGYDAFTVDIPSSQEVTSIAYSGATQDGYGDPMTFSIGGSCGFTSRNQTLSSPASNCDITWSFGSGFQTTTQSWTVTVNTQLPANNAPTASSFSTGSALYEGLTYTFATSEFGYSDGDGDALDHVLIEALPSTGILYVDADNDDAYDGGEELAVSSQVSKADLDAGHLQYTQNGSTDTSFQFEVNDGTDTSSGNYTVTLNVTSQPTVTLAVSPSSKTESTTTTNSVTATLSHTYGADVTVNLAFSGTASASTDYTRSASSITVNAGSTTGTITLTNVDDSLFENDETVVVDIDSVTNGVEGGTQQVIYTINNDDSMPGATLGLATTATGSITSTTGTITDESGGQRYIVAELSAPSSLSTTIPLSFSGTATGGGTDYGISASSISIAPGETQGSVQVTSFFDGIEEGDEDIVVDMDTPTNATETDTQQATITIQDEDAVAPTITSVGVPSDGTYAPGDDLNFTVNTSEVVTVDTNSGTPSLSMLIGTASVDASYISGTGSSSLVFNYTVQSGDLDTDGISVGSLSLAGGSIVDSVGINLDTTLNNVGTTSNVLVDGVAPTITSVAVPATGTYGTGDTLQFTVNTDEAVTVNTSGGTPTLSMVIGSSTTNATYVSGTGSSSLVFEYGVQAGDSDSDGIAVGTLSTAGGTLRDGAGNDLNTTLNSVGTTSNVLVDGVTPTVSSVSVPAGGTYAEGDTLQFTVNTSEAITVNTTGGTPTLSMLIGTSAVNARYVSGTGTSSLVFAYTVQSGDEDPDGIAVGSLSTAGGTMRDGGGNNLDTTLNNTGTTNSVLVDGVAPRVTTVAVPAASTYAIGDTLEFTVSLDEAVVVNTSGGTPALPLTIGTTGVNASYVSGSGTRDLVFSYTVQSGDKDGDGIVPGDLVTLGGLLRDAAGNDIDTTLNNAGSTSGVLVDGVAPAITAVSVPADDTYAAGDTLQFTVTTDEAITVGTTGGTPSISMLLGTTGVNADFVSGSGSSSLVFEYTVQDGDEDADGIALGNLVTGGGTLRDDAGNDMNTTLNNAGSTSNVFVDGVPPSVTAIALTSTPASDDGSVDFTVSFDESATNLSTDDFQLTTTGDAYGQVSGVSAETGNSVTITVNRLYGSGDVRLDLTAGTNIADAVGNTGVDAYITGDTHTVSRLPSVTSATYDVTTGTLVVSGQNLSALAGGSNDINASMFTLAGETVTDTNASYTSPYTLSSTTNVDISSETEFTLQVGNGDRAAVSGILTANGTTAADGTVYNLALADNWLAAAPASLDIGDPTGNAVTVSGAFTASANGTDTTSNEGEDGTATASVGGGVASYNFQWSSGDTTQTATALSAGTYTVLVTDNVGTVRRATATVADPANTAGQVSITGDAVVGSTLSANPSDSDGISGAITYEWRSGGSSVGGNSSAYTLQPSDVNQTLTVTVIYTDDLNYTESNTSAAVGPVVTVEQNALNTISETADGSGSTTPDEDTYSDAGVTGVTTRILALVNKAVSRQGSSADVDETAEIQDLVDVVLEGQDGDGDGLPNIFEGDDNVDTDGDGIADRDDTDADNDGIADALELEAITGDTDDDGILDAFDADVGNDDADGTDPGKTDANFDGVNDDVDTLEDLVTLFSANEDGDLYPDTVDADVDGDGTTDPGLTDANDDGVIDGQEAFADVLATLMRIDPDRDGVLNHLDLDADNDSLTDVSEAGFIDRNDDAFIDAGDTVITDAGQLPDTDANGTPDFLQLDSDGLSFDILSGPHGGRAGTLDADDDGQLDDDADIDGDGIADSVDNLVGFGLDNDQDDDGIKDINDPRIGRGPDIRAPESDIGPLSPWLLAGLVMVWFRRRRQDTRPAVR